MKLSDVMSHAGLAFYAEVALVIFVVVFLAVALSTMLGRQQAEHEAARMLPLDDQEPRENERARGPGGAARGEPEMEP